MKEVIKTKIKEVFKFNKKAYFWSQGILLTCAFLAWLLLINIIYGVHIVITKHLVFWKMFSYWNFSKAISTLVIPNVVILFILIISSIGISLWFGFKKKSKSKNVFLKKSKNTDYGNSRWLLDVRKEDGTGLNKPENYREFNEVYSNDPKEPFYLTASSIENGNLHYNTIPMKEAVNSIVYGIAGSGKSTKIVIPQIMLNAKILKQSNNQPSLVITDPKGEIYEQTAGGLKEQGYKVVTLNLRNPMESSKYNLLYNAYQFFMMGIDYEKNYLSLERKQLIMDKQAKCVTHNKTNCEECFNSFEELYYDSFTNKFISNVATEEENSVDYLQPSLAEAKDNYVSLIKTKYKTNSTQEINNIADTLFVANNEAQNRSFYDAAKAIVKATMLVLLELKEEDPNLFDVTKYNMPTILALVSNQEALTDFFKSYGKLHPTSTAWITGSGTFGASDNSRGNYFAYAKNGLSMFEDESLREILVANDVNFFDFANQEQPTAFFLIIPDDRKDKHALASIILKQLYQALVYTASLNVSTKGKDELDRTVSFVLDEFGNMPAIEDYDNMITAARGRKIFFQMILQDMQQLSKKYQGSEEIIKANSPLIIYLKTNSMKTLEMLSKQMGQETVEVKQVSGNSEIDKKISARLEKKDLMSAGQLANLPLKYSVILYAKSFPSIISFSPSYDVQEQLELNLPIYTSRAFKTINFAKDNFFDLFAYWDEQTKDQFSDSKPQSAKKHKGEGKKVSRLIVDLKTNDDHEDISINDEYEEILIRISELKSMSNPTLADKEELKALNVRKREIQAIAD